MAILTIRNLSDEAHRALLARASRHGRSIDAEACAILEDALRLSARRDDGVKLGSLLVEIGREARLSDDQLAELEGTRDRTPAAPLDLD